MRKSYTKIVAFLCVIVYLFSSVQPLSVKAYNYDYEVEYEFKISKDNSIVLKVLDIYDPENYEFKEYLDDSYHMDRTKTFKLYEKGSDYSSYIGGSGRLMIFNDDIYYIEDGIILVNQFYHLGKADDNNDYWIYLGKDGKMVKDTVIDGTFKIDKNGFFDYKKSDLYKRYLKEDSNYVPDPKKVTEVLNKTTASNLGKWVKAKDYVATKPLFSVDGYFEKDKNGKIRYWANSVITNTALLPSSNVRNYNYVWAGYMYLQDEKYDWRTSVIAENEYLKDMLIEIDGDYYYFNDKGYAAQYEWVFVEAESNYFDGSGKRVTNEWVSRDGELYKVDEDGSIITNAWLKEGN